MPFGETIVALATPAGESAIAMVRISGPDCPKIVQDAFKLKALPVERRASLGTYSSLDGIDLDHALFILFGDKRSYTGEPLLEISLHGNPLIVQNVIEDLVKRGCRMAEPGEFTRTSFANGKMDLSQAEAVSDLIRARSDKAIRAAQQQLGGALGRKINDLTDRLLQVIAEVEAYIDFPEEDLPPEDESGPALVIAKVREEIGALIKTSHYSTLLHEGIRTVIVGEPNAGKSSLLNALMGEDRVIVSEQPGTTRDVIQERLIVGPYCLQIMDTAGLREADSEIEKLGIEKTMEKMRLADFYLVVVDTAAPVPELPEEAFELLKPDKALVIENKADLKESVDRSGFLPDCPHIRVSLTTGDGMATFRELLVRTLEKDKVVPSEDALIVSARHATALLKAEEALEVALESMRSGDYTELMASDLRGALEAFGEVVGKVDNEAMLDKLFASFCIGK